MRNKKGISLIVLVITIIVMIILAAAVVVSLNNTGIIGKANVAVEATNKKQIEDLASLAWADAYMEGARTQEALEDAVDEALKDIDTSKYTIVVTEAGVSVKDGSSTNTPVTGWRIERTKDEDGLITKAVVTDGTVEYEIGTTVNYMPDGVGDTSYKGGWKLLGVDEQGRLLIMSSDSITGTTLTLTGEDGYINGLTTIQNAVNSYKDGTIGVAVRSVELDDINAITGYNREDFTGESYLETMKTTSGFTEEGVLSLLGLESREEITILDYNKLIRFAWDGTEYPTYSYKLNGNDVTKNLKTSYKTTGFKYFDNTTKQFAVSTFTNVGKDIVNINVDVCCYSIKTLLSETSMAYDMIIGNSQEGYLLNEHQLLIGINAELTYGWKEFRADMLGGDSLVSSTGTISSITNNVRAVVTLAAGTTLQYNETTSAYDIK